MVAWRRAFSESDSSSPRYPNLAFVDYEVLWCCVQFGVVRPCTPVTTGYCYRVRREGTGFGPKNCRPTLRLVAERQGFEPWDLVGLRFSGVLQSGRADPSAFDLGVRQSDLAPHRPPQFAGEDASEAAAHCWLQDHLGGATGVAADTTRVKGRG